MEGEIGRCGYEVLYWEAEFEWDETVVRPGAKDSQELPEVLWGIEGGNAAYAKSIVAQNIHLTGVEILEIRAQYWAYQDPKAGEIPRDDWFYEKALYGSLANVPRSEAW